MAAARILRLKVEPEIPKMVGGDSVVATLHSLTFKVTHSGTVRDARALTL